MNLLELLRTLDWTVSPDFEEDELAVETPQTPPRACIVGEFLYDEDFSDVQF